MRFIILPMLCFLMSLVQGQEQPVQFNIPIRCEINKTCWISRYMNLNTPEDPKDYQGGRLTDSDHNGVDFALRDLKQLEEGVDVLAVADGTVVGLRNHMPDIAVTPATIQFVKGKECGNGVTIDHGQGIQSQYCHMKFDSFKVKIHDRVKAGQPLGRVGLSGLSDYPHLHLTTLYKGRKIDPFLGIPTTSHNGISQKRTLWSKQALTAMPYEAAKLFNFGIAQEDPDLKKLRSGQYRYSAPLSNPPKIVGCFELFAVNKDDKIIIRLLDPHHKERTKHEVKLPKYQARIYIYSGLNKPKEGWSLGIWQFQVDYERFDGKQKYSKIEKFEIQ